MPSIQRTGLIALFCFSSAYAGTVNGAGCLLTHQLPNGQVQEIQDNHDGTTDASCSIDMFGDEITGHAFSDGGLHATASIGAFDASTSGLLGIGSEIIRPLTIASPTTINVSAHFDGDLTGSALPVNGIGGFIYVLDPDGHQVGQDFVGANFQTPGHFSKDISGSFLLLPGEFQIVTIALITLETNSSTANISMTYGPNQGVLTPEPSTWLLGACGLCLLGLSRLFKTHASCRTSVATD